MGLAEAVLLSTHYLCFGAKITKIGIPCIPQFCYIKVGFKGVYITWTCFPDEYGHSSTYMYLTLLSYVCIMAMSNAAQD